MPRDVRKRNSWACICVGSAGQLPDNCVRCLPSYHSVVTIPLTPNLHHFVYLRFLALVYSQVMFPRLGSSSSHHPTSRLQSPDTVLRPMMAAPHYYIVPAPLRTCHYPTLLATRCMSRSGPFSSSNHPIQCIVHFAIITSLDGEDRNCDGGPKDCLCNVGLDAVNSVWLYTLSVSASLRHRRRWGTGHGAHSCKSTRAA